MSLKLKIRPTLASHNPTDRRFSNVKPRGQILLQDITNGVEATYFKHIDLLKRRIRAVLSDAVALVLKLRPSKQMIWPKTGRVVAAMADLMGVWDFPYYYAVSQSMNALDATAIADIPISSCASSGAGPFQAGIALWDSLKHGLQQLVTGRLKSHCRALLRLQCWALAAFACCGAFFIVPQEALRH